jgi:hypothetical protein
MGHQANERHLVYVFGEPSNASEHPEVVEHQAEVAELVIRVGDLSPRLHVRTYRQLLAEWSSLTKPEWVEQHVAELRRRYQLPGAHCIAQTRPPLLAQSSTELREVVNSNAARLDRWGRSHPLGSAPRPADLSHR